MYDQPQQNPKKLFVGNLPYSATESQLQDLFGQFGEIVSVKLVVDKMTGRSKGIAFVEFATVEQANAAISALQEHEMDGRKIVVNVARPFVPKQGGFRSDSRGGFGGGGGYRQSR